MLGWHAVPDRAHSQRGVPAHCPICNAGRVSARGLNYHCDAFWRMVMTDAVTARGVRVGGLRLEHPPRRFVLDPTLQRHVEAEDGRPVVHVPPPPEDIGRFRRGLRLIEKVRKAAKRRRYVERC